MDGPNQPLWYQHLVDLKTPTDVDTISQTVASVLKDIRRHGSESISLNIACHAPVNAAHLICVLRTTYTWRHKIYDWHAALTAAPAILRAQGIDPELELHGLNK